MRAVFIVSPMERSGTNLLTSVLTHSGELDVSPVHEDNLLRHSGPLVDSVDQLSDKWRWFLAPDAVATLRTELLERLGVALLDVVAPLGPKRLATICKTPSTQMVHNFPLLFPYEKLVLMVRDGRDTVASYMSAWPEQRTFMDCVETWAENANEMEAFVRAHAASQGTLWELVRFEDLVLDPSSTVSELTAFLNMRAPAVELEQVPVYGSSFVDRGVGKFEWRETGRPASFNPIGRWKAWKPSQIDAFMEIAGRAMAFFGYSVPVG